MSEPRGASQDGPRAGQRVRDAATGCVGILQDVCEYADPSQPPWLRHPPRLMAFIRPEGGGREWMTLPENVTAAE